MEIFDKLQEDNLSKIHEQQEMAIGIEKQVEREAKIKASLQKNFEE